jgi:hypothetical protein
MWPKYANLWTREPEVRTGVCRCSQARSTNVDGETQQCSRVWNPGGLARAFQESKYLCLNFEVRGVRSKFFYGTSRQKNRALDGRQLRAEDSKLSPIYRGLFSTFYSLKCSEWPLPMAFAFEKLSVYQKAVDFADQI